MVALIVGLRQKYLHRGEVFARNQRIVYMTRIQLNGKIEKVVIICNMGCFYFQCLYSQ